MVLQDIQDILIMGGVGLTVVFSVFYVLKQLVNRAPKVAEFDPDNPIEQDDQVFLSRYVPNKKPPENPPPNNPT